MNQPKCPECEKLKKVSKKSQVIGEFLDWLLGDGEYVIAEIVDDDGDENLFPVHESTEQLLAAYFKIDLVKVEKERRALLDCIREKK